MTEVGIGLLCMVSAGLDNQGVAGRPGPGSGLWAVCRVCHLLSLTQRSMLPARQTGGLGHG